jgi:hypothetical protein
MTVAELQMLLSDVGKFLRATAGATAAGELEYLSGKLQPFAGQKLKAFADSLDPAQKPPPASAPKGGGKKGKADPLAVDQAFQRILDVYGKAIDPAVSMEQIEAAVADLQSLDPTKARLDELARQMGYSQKFKDKPEVLKAIRQKIIGRKGAFERPTA